MEKRRKTQNSQRWRILIRLRNNNKKDKIVFAKNSSKLDPEEAWSTVFSDWLGKHRNLTITGMTDKGVIVKERSGKVSELFVDCKRIDPES